ncbi:MAG: repressor LexA [Patescibacteria group bacterium]|jgi:repressor LexA|nr:repressor LexA [Patescibacteria group bacterium]
MDLTKAVVTFRNFYRKQKRLPSYQEVCDLFNYSSKTAAVYLVNKLIETDILEKDEKGKLLPKKLFHIPHLGIIKAGYPMPAEGSLGDSIDFYEYLLGMPGEMFSLTVSGDSMIEEGIHDGDIVIVERDSSPRNGDIVAACIDGEWTVKYFKNDNGHVGLYPANPSYPVLFPTESLMIGGVVVSVIRKYR